MDKKKPDVYFTERSHELTTTISGLKRTALMLSWLRLFSFLSIILLGWWLWPMGLLPAFTGIGAGLLLFIVIVKRDLDNKTAIENT